MEKVSWENKLKNEEEIPKVMGGKRKPMEVIMARKN